MQSRSELTELLHRQEPLTPELEDYVFRSKLGGKMIHHPLMIEMFYDPSRCALINERYRRKIEMLDKAKAEKRWSSFIFLHERPYRLEALRQAHIYGLHNEEYWDMVGAVWIDSENIFQNIDVWKNIWRSPDAHRTNVMDPYEKAVYDALADQCAVWRGIQFMKSKNGLSWTMNYDRAKWFARRWAISRSKAKPRVVWGTVAKQDVLAVFLGRHEEELVSDRVKIIKVELI